jgi:hypothetical protein
MTSYYDEETDTTYYENTIVVEFCQLEKGRNVIDMRIFMLYDADEDLMYLYGSRKSDNFPRYPTFVKTFSDRDVLYDFLDVMMDFTRHKIETAVHQIDYLTDYSDFDEIQRKTSNLTQLSGFDNVTLTKKDYKKYINVLF